jgi:hypothetical protein
LVGICHLLEQESLNSPSPEEGVVCAFWKKIRVFALLWDQSRAIMSVEGVNMGKIAGHGRPIGRFFAIHGKIGIPHILWGTVVRLRSP